jgi:hypothetical protein
MVNQRRGNSFSFIGSTGESAYRGTYVKEGLHDRLLRSNRGQWNHNFAEIRCIDGCLTNSFSSEFENVRAARRRINEFSYVFGDYSIRLHTKAHEVGHKNVMPLQTIHPGATHEVNAVCSVEEDVSVFQPVGTSAWRPGEPTSANFRKRAPAPRPPHDPPRRRRVYCGLARERVGDPLIPAIRIDRCVQRGAAQGAIMRR